ncbi:Arb2 domain-containing protein [Hypoxylon crocopeplum]|nr:Arb2 domain-containing protein [Hypoxylon crocopeplum]
MFRRKWSGLPADPDFPVDLKKLGYFINEVDEVRSIENPNNYFKYFISRNPRWNDRQRFAFNHALQEVIWERLEKLGMKKVLLPLNTMDETQPHVPIFVSRDIVLKTRVVVIFGESMQDLGVLAHRVLGGPGGVDTGSMVSIVAALQAQQSSATDSKPPGIILANMGELCWWPAGHRTLSRIAFDDTPMKTAVQAGNALTAANEVPGNDNMKTHVHYIFDKVVPRYLNKRAKVDVLGVGDSADIVEEYLDLPPTWKIWKDRINCLALVGGLHPIWQLRSEDFAKRFLRDKARAYAPSLEPAGMVLSGPDGNSNTATFTQMGCPVISSGEPHYTECMLIAGSQVVLDWLQEVALTPDGEEYANPEFEILHADPNFGGDDGNDWGQLEDTDPEGEKVRIKLEHDEEGDVGKQDKGGEEPRLVLLQRPNDDQNKVIDVQN